VNIFWGKLKEQKGLQAVLKCKRKFDCYYLATNPGAATAWQKIQPPIQTTNLTGGKIPATHYFKPYFV
jgi:hypothetical protein